MDVLEGFGFLDFFEILEYVKVFYLFLGGVSIFFIWEDIVGVF